MTDKPSVKQICDNDSYSNQRHPENTAVNVITFCALKLLAETETMDIQWLHKPGHTCSHL